MGNKAETLLAFLAYKAAEKQANQGCPFLFHCTKMPDKVKKLRKI